VSVKLSLVIALVLTFAVHHVLVRRAAAVRGPKLSVGGKVRRWFDAAAIAVIGTLVLMGGIHWLGILARSGA
jgi:hypothetical protein